MNKHWQNYKELGFGTRIEVAFCMTVLWLLIIAAVAFGGWALFMLFFDKSEAASVIRVVIGCLLCTTVAFYSMWRAAIFLDDGI